MSFVKTPYNAQMLTSTQPPSSVGLTVFANDEDASGLWKWIFLAAAVHLLLVLGIAFIILIFQFLGWNIPLFSTNIKPREDLEFVLVDNTPVAQPKRPTNRRAEHASRSGGQKIANRPTQMPQQAAGAPSPRAVAKPAFRPQPQAQNNPAPRPAPQPRQQQPSTRPNPQPQPRQSNAPTPTPSPTPPAPKLPRPIKIANASPSLPPNPIAPTIRTPAPPNPSISGGGPIVKAPGSSSSGGSRSSSGNPGPSMIAGNPSRGASGNPGSAGRTGGGGGSGGRGAYNQSGSPGGGGGNAGVDAMAEPDFGPYIAELQRRIRRNWTPPTEDRSKRIVALFKVSRDGRLLSLRVLQSSGSQPADQAAIAAVRASAPFRSLPPNYRGNDIDVQFIFDYEIYGHGSAKMH